MTALLSCMHPPLVGLYAITPDETDTPRLQDNVTAALEGGCRWLQYRHKCAAPALREYQAGLLAELCRWQGAGFIVNDDARLAASVGATGVHLGQTDGDPVTARAILGDDAVIGMSGYQDASRVAQWGETPQYVAFGAAYPSLSKPHVALAPLALYQRAVRELAMPVCAIGGITLENAAPLVSAGVAMLAVISDLFSRPPAAIAARVAAYQTLFKELSP